MPRIRFVRGVVFRGESKGPGDELDVSEREAFALVEGYHDAVRIDGEAPVLTGMTVREQIQTQDPVAQHRDPAVQPSRRNR